MLMDVRTQFCNATALNLGAPATFLIGSQIDVQPARDLGQGKPIFCVIQVETTVTGGATTVDFKLASDATAAIAVDGSATVHASTGPIAVAALVAGKRFVLALPPEGDVPYEKFLGILQTTGGAAVTAGKIHAFLTTDPPGWKAMPAATGA